MAKIIAICGKICCGKTWYANRLKQQEKAVILSCDELTHDLFDNDLGDRHDEMALRIWNYFRKKAVELVKADCNVILDWGFWQEADRKALNDYCRAHQVFCSWHYIHVDDPTWQKNIAERNQRILEGHGGSDYYLDQGLLDKLLSRWEMPREEDMDVYYVLNRT